MFSLRGLTNGVENREGVRNERINLDWPKSVQVDPLVRLDPFS